MKWSEMKTAFDLWRRLCAITMTQESEWTFHPGEPDDDRDYAYIEHTRTATVVPVTAEMADAVSGWSATAQRRQALERGGPALEILIRRESHKLDKRNKAILDRVTRPVYEVAK